MGNHGASIAADDDVGSLLVPYWLFRPELNRAVLALVGEEPDLTLDVSNDQVGAAVTVPIPSRDRARKAGARWLSVRTEQLLAPGKLSLP
jgi:hypothetical protein